jgi:hypothetical protein
MWSLIKNLNKLSSCSQNCIDAVMLNAILQSEIDTYSHTFNLTDNMMNSLNMV